MHLYTHIPFCERKCAYCGFYSVRASEKEIRRYPDLLFREYQMYVKRFPDRCLIPESWYLGGGTPSLLGAEGMRYLAALFSQCFSLEDLREWSIEINPASATEELFQTLRSLGVTRISIGAQSFDDRILARAGRIHNAEKIFQAIASARRAGFRDVGIDLIAGLPLSNEQIWRDTLSQAVDLNLQHLSVYALTLEPKTRFAAEAQKRKDEFFGDDEMMDQIQTAETVLTDAGFERYEISNYARPQLGCKYNLAVWRGEDYLGLGPAAASRVGNERWTHAADLSKWRSAIEQGQPPPNSFAETLSPGEDLLERALYRLRLLEGIRRDQLPSPFWKDWLPILQKLSSEDITEEIEPDHWRLTSRGREVCDAVLAELLAHTETDEIPNGDDPQGTSQL